MRSKWYESKPKAIIMRRRGLSIRRIEALLRVPRSTLSGWLRDIPLTARQRKKLHQQWLNGFKKARLKAAAWHRHQKTLRIQEAKRAAATTLRAISSHDPAVLDLALAMLYLGEGFKKGDNTSMGNSDPLILRFFITLLRKNYNVPLDRIRCALHLRADQKPQAMKRFWSHALGIPEKNFQASSIDKRTAGFPTYPHYKGVCVVSCGHVAIQRKLIHLATLFCKNISKIYLDA